MVNAAVHVFMAISTSYCTHGQWDEKERSTSTITASERKGQLSHQTGYSVYFNTQGEHCPPRMELP